jgi:hypothetical protein
MPKQYILRRLATSYPIDAIAVTWSGDHYFRLISLKPSPTSIHHWEGVVELLETQPPEKPQILLADEIEKLEELQS